MRSVSLRHAAVVAAFVALAACGKSETPPPSAPAAAVPTAVSLNAPAGQYQLDPNHTVLLFSVNHLGLSNYTMRFTKYDAAIQLDPANVGSSSVELKVDATSVRTDFPGDYKAAHKESPYQSWEEDLAQSPKFLNAGQFPELTFRSTKIEPAGAGKYRITGDLTLVGQTHPLTLDATLVGSYDKHPFTGRGALGFSATGTFDRSTYGMKHLLEPKVLVGDAVTIRFEGEFQQAESGQAPEPQA